MMSKVARGILLASSLGAIVAADPALAQDAGDIVVTARRVEERLQDVPISITVFNQQQLDNRNIVSASDLGTYTPSLTANSRFGPDKSSFTIRGFSQESNTSPTVGVYFADVVAPRAAAGTASGNGAGPGSFFDLQNVQVLKGPQGTLFGRNTTGGAVLLLPRRPTDQFEGYVEGSLGSHDLRRVQAVINVPLAPTFKVRFGIDRNQRDGYLRNRSGLGPDKFGDVDYLALRLGILGELTPDLENYTVATYSKSTANGILGRVFACQRDPALQGGRAAFTARAACDQVDRQDARGDGFYDVENNVPNPYNNSEQWQVINTTTWLATDNLTVKNIASYGEFRERVGFNITGDNFFSTNPAFPRFVGQPFANTILYNIPGRYSAIQSTFTEELRLQGVAANGALTWQTGGYFESSQPMGGNTSYSQSLIYCADASSLQCTGYFGNSSSLSIVDNEVSFRNIGLYGQGTYELSDKLAVTAGLRYTWDRTKGTGRRLAVRFNTPNVPVGTCANPLLRPGLVTLDLNDCASPTFVQSSARPTWLIDLEYKPSNDAMLYVKYSRGYRQGGVNPSLIGLETWNPEKVDTYEVGAKTSFRGAVSGFFNVTAFYNDFTDQQISAIATSKASSGLPGARLVVNAGKSRLWGVEVDTSLELAKGLRLDGGYAYLNTKLIDFVAPVLAPTSPYERISTDGGVGGVLPLAPKHRLTSTLTYTLPLDESVGRVSFGATYTYTSSQVAASTSLFGTLPSSELVNLNLNWESIAGLPVDLAAFVTNLTKEEVPLNVSGNWQSLGFESYIPGAPRMWGVRLKYRFGS